MTQQKLCGIRVVRFSEKRISRPVKGSLLNETANFLVSRPISSQINDFLALDSHAVISSPVSTITEAQVDDCTYSFAVSVFAVINKRDLTQQTYS